MKGGPGTNTPSHQVTLEFEDGRVLWGPQPVLVHVKDENDQVPHFSQAIYRVQLSQDTRPGEFLGEPQQDQMGTAHRAESKERAGEPDQAQDNEDASPCSVLSYTH